MWIRKELERMVRTVIILSSSFLPHLITIESPVQLDRNQSSDKTRWGQWPWEFNCWKGINLQFPVVAALRLARMGRALGGSDPRKNNIITASASLRFYINTPLPPAITAMHRSSPGLSPPTAALFASSGPRNTVANYRPLSIVRHCSNCMKIPGTQLYGWVFSVVRFRVFVQD